MSVSVIEGQDRAAMDVEIELCPVPESARRARDFVRAQFIRWGLPGCAEDAALIADELVSNALNYAPETPFSVMLRRDHGSPVIEVADGSPDLPVLKPPDFLAESGRGLHIVDALSLAWDSYPVSGGKVVWAKLRAK
jgi:anti-sigma regulatory factor (Ser/Thr protein kinase)